MLERGAQVFCAELTITKNVARLLMLLLKPKKDALSIIALSKKGTLSLRLKFCVVFFWWLIYFLFLIATWI